MPVDWNPGIPLSPLLGPEIRQGDLVRIDLGIGSALLSGWTPGDQAGLSEAIHGEIRRNNGKLGWGGYLEVRSLYAASSHFDAGDEPRNLHLGLDIWGEAGQAVHVPANGRIHSLAMNGAHLDYGATILLEHVGPAGPFWTLYGHLAERDLHWRPGTQVRAGEVLAHLGTQEENGGWVPHLHVQVILDLGDHRGDFPGVARLSERDGWSARCPDPTNLICFPWNA